MRAEKWYPLISLVMAFIIVMIIYGIGRGTEIELKSNGYVSVSEWKPEVSVAILFGLFCVASVIFIVSSSAHAFNYGLTMELIVALLLAIPATYISLPAAQRGLNDLNLVVSQSGGDIGEGPSITGAIPMHPTVEGPATPENWLDAIRKKKW
jgi:hypothetical protein